MIKIDIPGRETIEIEHVVLDYNGTIALDGQLIAGAAERIRELSKLAPGICAYCGHIRHRAGAVRRAGRGDNDISAGERG